MVRVVREELAKQEEVLAERTRKFEQDSAYVSLLCLCSCCVHVSPLLEIDGLMRCTCLVSRRREEQLTAQALELKSLEGEYRCAGAPRAAILDEPMSHDCLSDSCRCSERGACVFTGRVVDSWRRRTPRSQRGASRSWVTADGSGALKVVTDALGSHSPDLCAGGMNDGILSFLLSHLCSDEKRQVSHKAEDLASLHDAIA